MKKKIKILAKNGKNQKFSQKWGKKSKISKSTLLKNSNGTGKWQFLPSSTKTRI